jgi:hypothetical protein
VGNVLAATADGGFIVVGTTNSFGVDDEDTDDDAWLLKLTRTGEVEFAPDSDATIGNNTGEFHNPENVKALDTTADPVNLPLMVIETTDEVLVIDADLTVRQQAP